MVFINNVSAAKLHIRPDFITVEKEFASVSGLELEIVPCDGLDLDSQIVAFEIDGLTAKHRIEVASQRGRRIVPWDEFFTGVKQTSLAADEMITAVVLPDEAPRAEEFAKVGPRNAMVISTVSCVVARTASGFRVALGSVAPTPMRARRAEAMVNAEVTPSAAAITEFGRIVSEEVRPITDHRSTEAYRRHASGVLARRLLERCIDS